MPKGDYFKTQEWKEKQKERMLGLDNPMNNPESRKLQALNRKGKGGEAVSKAMKGKLKSIEHCRNISKSKLGNKCFLGKRHSEITKELFSEQRKGCRLGKENSNWRGGTTSIGEMIRVSERYLSWRMQILIRDNFTCKKCGRQIDLEVHHIRAFWVLLQEARSYLPLLSLYEAAMLYTPLWNLDNGETLCEDCHMEKDSFRKRVGKRK